MKLRSRKSAAGSTAAKPRVVVDTNVLISAFAFGGLPEQTIRLVLQRTQVWVSPSLLQEYRQTPQELLAQGKINRAQFQAMLTGLASFLVGAKLVQSRRRLAICRDPEDDMVLECCCARTMVDDQSEALRKHYGQRRATRAIIPGTDLRCPTGRSVCREE